MTDAARREPREMNERERMARRICNELVFLGGSERESFVLKALADERRRVWEEAAKLMCPYCNDPEWITYDPEGDHISPHTGNVFICKSRKIRAKAHAGQEG